MNPSPDLRNKAERNLKFPGSARRQASIQAANSNPPEAHHQLPTPEVQRLNAVRNAQFSQPSVVEQTSTPTGPIVDASRARKRIKARRLVACSASHRGAPVASTGYFLSGRDLKRWAVRHDRPFPAARSNPVLLQCSPSKETFAVGVNPRCSGSCHVPFEHRIPNRQFASSTFSRAHCLRQTRFFASSGRDSFHRKIVACCTIHTC